MVEHMFTSPFGSKRYRHQDFGARFICGTLYHFNVQGIVWASLESLDSKIVHVPLRLRLKVKLLVKDFYNYFNKDNRYVSR